jgi:tetratricopeptide (TPR) repeat protein
MLAPRVLAPLVLVSLCAAPALARAQEGLASGSASQVLEELEAWDVEAAEAIVRRLALENPDDPGVRFLEARVAFELGEYDRAVELYDAALGDRAAGSPDYSLAVAAAKEARGTVVEESAHFTIRYKPGRDAALVPYAVEALEAAFDALTKDLGYAPPRKVRVEFYGSAKALARVSSLTEEAIKTTGTIALCKYNRLMVTSPRALVRGYEWQDTLAHEFVHFLVTRKSRNTVPIWLHEGMAKYLETRWRGPAGLALEPAAEVLLARAVKADKLITFQRMHPSIAMLPSQEDAALAFAEVFTAIEFVDRKATMNGVQSIIERMRAGKTDREAVSLALALPFERFEAQWKASLRTRPLPKGARELEKLQFQDEKQQARRKEKENSWDRGELGGIANPEARKHAHLGELFRGRNRLGPAALEFERAIQLAGPSYPPLARKYALVKIAGGQGADAEKALRASLAEYPNDDTNHLLLGQVLVQSGRAAEAGRHFMVANQRNPFDPGIHAGLLAVARALGDAGLESRERDVIAILGGTKTTWRAAVPGGVVSLGYLRIETPVGARVVIDGVDTGLTTPVSEHPLAAGSHVVRLELEGAERIERTVTIAADQLVPFPQP